MLGLEGQATALAATVTGHTAAPELQQFAACVRAQAGDANGSRRRAATAKLDAQAEATDLVVVTSEGDLGTGQALAQQCDELAHPGQRLSRVADELRPRPQAGGLPGDKA
jgi:hypothetical protein